MTRFCGLIQAALGMLMFPAAAVAADQPIMQKTFNATVDQVYAAEVQAVGPTLKYSQRGVCG
jgi:hypothetical protein